MNIPSHMRYAPAVTLTLERHYYSNGRTALRAVDCDTGEPIAMLTVNIPEITLEPGQVLIKDYSENEGVLESLLLAAVVEPLAVIPCNHAEVILCKLIKEIS